MAWISRAQRETAKLVTGGYWCFWCGRERGPQGCNPYDACGHEHHDKLHVDHVIPASCGGANDPWNLVIACQRCNIGRRDRSTRAHHGWPDHLATEFLFLRCLALGLVS